ncbi:MAG TPA: hypothetical protein VFE51_02775 [Verrucomicrobiae bacterium]|nr:hypothetical protein [Verrucomicrobiae bacterium]
MVSLAIIITGCATQKTESPQVLSAATVAKLQPTLSPELRGLLDHSLEARAVLSRALAQTSRGRQVRVRYYYRNDAREPWSDYLEYGPRLLHVGLAMSQTAWDEYVLLVFELENSVNGDASRELWASVLQGKLSASDYASGLLKLEYAALCRAKVRIESVSAVDPQLAESQRYHEMIDGTQSLEKYVKLSEIAHDNYANYAEKVRATQR